MSDLSPALPDHASFQGLREEFEIPTREGREVAYFCGNSLGLMPKATPSALARVTEQWRTHAVEAHFTDADAWMPYHELVRDSLARVAGAKPSEVVAMNTLTTNLHLMMVSFYRPTPGRRKILIEARAFPSDRYAAASQIAFHGGDPATDLIELAPLPGSHLIHPEQITEVLAAHGEQIALILWPGVQYASGQCFDLAAITAQGHRHGCVVGFDLAHAIGNVQVNLHASGADFAVWCSYKYLNAGPGAIAGCFVHERHAHSDRPRFAGWWGHDPASRFEMGPTFSPTAGADGWQLSNPSILSLAPLRASLEIFNRVGMDALCRRSRELTDGLAKELEDSELRELVELITPRTSEQRGCQLSIRVRAGRELGRSAFAALASQGVIGDWREPDVIRVAPTPMYNTQDDCARLISLLLRHLRNYR